MNWPTAVEDAINRLAQDSLRHIVLLKHLLAYPQHVTVHRVNGSEGAATLVTLDTSVSSYDRQTYPNAAVAAFIASDHPNLTVSLMAHCPRGVGIVFKLSQEADLPPVEAHFPVIRRAAFLSFTSAGRFNHPPGVRITSTPSDTVFAMFGTQDHQRAWLEPLLRNGTAFACVLERDGETHSVCFAFENFGSIWEVGGVVTPSPYRRRGFGTLVVRAALAELTARGLVPRYQVGEDNTASIRLARSVGLVPFLTIFHYEHAS